MTGSARRDDCRSCGSRRLDSFLSLGRTPLANSFLRSEAEFDSEPAFPLELFFCHDCTLVQLVDVVDAESMFRDYIYVTGTSDTMAAHNRTYASDIVQEAEPAAGDLVVEVGSNDGSLLSCVAELGVRTLGIDPASNVVARARERGVESLDRFFDAGCARDVRASHGQAKAIVGNNVFAHVDDPNGFLQGCRHLLAKDGVVIIEVPYLGDLVTNLEYDTVYHEHLCYFSVRALDRLFRHAGLNIYRVRRVAVHGGSIRVHAAVQRQPAVGGGNPETWLSEESRAGLDTLDLYRRFANGVAESREALVGMLESLARDGHSVAGYGAPAKGNTLLNYCGIDTRLLPFTVDKNPMKVGTFTPGTHIPVRPVEEIAIQAPSHVLILAWNFAGEIMRQQQEYRDGGGRFIIPVPRATVA